MRPFLTAALFSLCAACAIDSSNEDVSDTESELAYGDRSFLQVYNTNTKHMSQKGKPSFEGSDFTELLSYMKTQAYVPDVITAQEVGTNRDDFTSQPCEVFTKELHGVAKNATWKCIVAEGAPSNLHNSPGGVAIIHRARLVPKGEKVLVPLYYWSPKGCNIEHGWKALVQKFEDGKHTVAVASVHLPVASSPDGTGATADDCSGRNLAAIERALAETHADVKILAGDMNHGDATRKLDAKNNLVLDHWETTYVRSNDLLDPKAAYRDAFYRDCANVKKTANEISTCLVENDWSFNGKGKNDARIDWVLVSGAHALKEARTIPFGAVHYSDHRAQTLRVVY